jgi:signal transduction histidine kinase
VCDRERLTALLCSLSAELLYTPNAPLDDSQRCYLDTIVHAGQQLLALVNAILDYAKLEAGALLLQVLMSLMF